MGPKLLTKVRLGFILVSLILVLSFQGACSAPPRGFQVVAENEYLTLFFHPETTEIAVRDRLEDVLWYSNPEERDKMETIARGTAKDALGAQLRITYFTPGDVRRTMNSFTDSVAYGQFEVKERPDGVVVDYVLGRQWDEDDYFPVVLDVKTYEDVLLPSLNRGDRRLLAENYVQINLVYASEGGDLGSYRIESPTENLRSRDQATFAQVLGEHISAQMSSLSHRRDVRDQHLERFAQESFYMLRSRKGDLLAWDREDLIALFRDLEFTPFDVGAIYERFGLDPLVPNMFTFTIAIEYRLEGRNLVVRVPWEGITFPRNILDSNNQRVTYPLVAVDVLPYFGAAHSTDEGYIFVPDGCGALIYLNNGKVDASPYGGVIYGSDHGLAAPPASLVRGQQNYLPVFGLKKGDAAFLAILEEGDSIAQVNADIAGRQISYNMVYPQFRTMAQTTAQLQGEMPERIHGQASQWVNTSQRMINVYQQELVPSDLTIRYGFLHGERADYVGMAQLYRDHLFAGGQTPKEEFPFFLELVGAINDVRPILGVPLPSMEPLTTFADVQTVVEAFAKRDVPPTLTLSGWLEGGLNHLVPSKVRLESSLGTSLDFTRLVRFLEEEGVDFFPAVDILLVHGTRLGEFMGRSEASRFLNRAQAQVDREYVFSPMTSEFVHNRSWVLSPGRINQLLQDFLQDYDQYGIGQMALKDLGYLLHSDFRQGQEIYRPEAKERILQALGSLTGERGIRLQVSGGNAYLFPFVDSILNLPFRSGRQDLVDEEVPFFPIVIRGFVDYAGEPLNFAADYQTAVLKTVETGASPYFLGFYGESSFLKQTNFNYLYTGQVASWFDQAVALYHQLNGDLRGFRGEPIIGHGKLEENVYQTIYPQGSVIVNYNPHPVVVGPLRIEARDYLVVGGADR